MLLFALVVVAIVMFALMVVIHNVGRTRRHRVVLGDFANRVGGVLSANSYQTTVTLRRRGETFVVKGRYHKGKLFLQIQAAWPDHGFRAKFFPETLTDELKRFIGMQDIKIGNPRFDQRFVVQSSDESWLLDLLDQHVQEAILRLDADAVLNISGGRIQMDVPCLFKDEASVEKHLERFANIYLIFRGALKSSQPNIAFHAVSMESDQATCLICGDPISEQLINCRSCRTPHHQECWEYLGQCSTYGCGQTKFTTKSNPYFIRI